MIIPTDIHNVDRYHVVFEVSYQAVTLIRSQFKSSYGHANLHPFNMN